MLDQYGRRINYLRISVTDRCNLRCRYCMPEGVQDVGMKNILTFEEIWEIVKTGVRLGITHIRITGGEPLVRKGCADLILGIRKIPGVETITMTTNGVLLGNYAKQLKEAGVDGVNISLDTLDPEEFCQITGKRELPAVLAGIRAAKDAGLPVKLNAVNRKELDPVPLVRYAQNENLPLRFIEMMPVGYGKQYVGRSNELPREKRVQVGLTYVYGIGQTTANKILEATGINPDTRVKDLTLEEEAKIRDYIDQANIIVEGDLRRNVALDIKRLVEIQSFRGTRHRKNLPCRGQRTKTNARTCKGPKRTVANKKK